MAWWARASARALPTYIPVVESDFIFSAVGEEMGLLGSSAVLVLFLLLCVRGFATAARAKSDSSAFAAVGLTSAPGLPGVSHRGRRDQVPAAHRASPCPS